MFSIFFDVHTDIWTTPFVAVQNSKNSVDVVFSVLCFHLTLRYNK